MKSRLALTLAIIFGFALSTTGVTLAITGASGSGSAAQNQYEAPKGEALRGGANDSPPSTSEQVSVASQSTDTLPFTGFVAIPLLITGVALMGGGMILRRRNSKLE